MKISLVQMNIRWEEKVQNIRSAQYIVENCAASGTDFVAFPEMSFTGFSMNTDLTGEFGYDTVERVSQLAKKFSVHIGFGWVDGTGQKSKNIYSIIDKSGTILSSYAKIHPFSYSGEDEKFDGGDQIVTFQIDDAPFSNFICYDLRFPELFRAVANKVHAILIPACWPAKRSEHWKTLLRARAIENQVYIFAVNCQGDIGGQYYSGDSCVINPDGKVMEILSDKDGVITYNFIDDVEEYRSLFPVLKDGKPELYKKFWC